jgi:hypothetical protein
MTDVEIMRQEAKRLLENGKLTGRNILFVSQIMKYNKKRLSHLTSKQFRWLKDIVMFNK